MNRKTPKAVSPESARVRLETMCARAEHCTHELREKLWQWQIRGAEADEIIEALKKLRYVDDRRFVKAFINDKVRFARWGRRKILQALYLKRVDRDIVADEMENIDVEIYESNLVDLMGAKARSIDEPCTFEGRTKLFRFGISRGFEPELVARVIKARYVGEQ